MISRFAGVSVQRPTTFALVTTVPQYFRKVWNAFFDTACDPKAIGAVRDRSKGTLRFFTSHEEAFRYCIENHVPVDCRTTMFHGMDSNATWNSRLVSVLRFSVTVSMRGLRDARSLHNNRLGIDASDNISDFDGLVIAGTKSRLYHRSGMSAGRFSPEIVEQYAVDDPDSVLTSQDAGVLLGAVHDYGQWTMYLPHALKPEEWPILQALVFTSPNYFEVLPEQYERLFKPYERNLFGRGWRYREPDVVHHGFVKSIRLDGNEHAISEVYQMEGWADGMTDAWAEVLLHGAKLRWFIEEGRIKTYVPNEDVLPQKARALERIRRSPYKNTMAIPLPPMHIAIPGRKDTYFRLTRSSIPRMISSRIDDWFVRPCPEVPNHGMKVAGYESQRVERKKAPFLSDAICKKMLKEQLKGAVIVMPYYDARFSAVIAPNQYIAIGRGNDGVTAGSKERVYTFPMRDEPNAYAFIEGVGEKREEVELEIVYSTKTHPYLVQIRRAPAHDRVGAPPSPDAVQGLGRSIRIEEIVVVNSLDDLEKVTEAKGRTGVLVVEPGGARLSHAAAHSRSCGHTYAVCAPDHFAVGEEITATDGWIVRGRLENAREYDFTIFEDAFWSGVEFARVHWRDELGMFSIFFHTFVSGPLTDPVITARLGGMFVGWLATAGIMACIGEMRHVAGSEGLYRARAVKPLVRSFFTHDFGFRKTYGNGLQRNTVYLELSRYDASWREWAALGEVAWRVFNVPKWPSGFGGAKWADAARSAADLALAIEKRDLMEAIEVANALENKVHNGGHLYDKFLQRTYFDMGTSGVSLAELRWLPGVVEAAENVLKDEPKSDKQRPDVSWEEIAERACERFHEEVVMYAAADEEAKSCFKEWYPDFDKVVEEVEKNPPQPEPVKARRKAKPSAEAANLSAVLNQIIQQSAQKPTHGTPDAILA